MMALPSLSFFADGATWLAWSVESKHTIFSFLLALFFVARYFTARMPVVGSENFDSPALSLRWPNRAENFAYCCEQFPQFSGRAPADIEPKLEM